LYQYIGETLNIDKQNIIFWTDSTSVLWWIRGHSIQFKPFVANRIGEIQASVSPDRWRYVPIRENPADYLTRGPTLVEILQLRAWWEGPAFLMDSQCKMAHY